MGSKTPFGFNGKFKLKLDSGVTRNGRPIDSLFTLEAMEDFHVPIGYVISALRG